jgi:exopolysaccharide production protein ExoZ
MLYNLQLLRAIAAAFVVVAHLTALNPPTLGRLLAFGLYGVDLFFVISGFVMVHTTMIRPVTPAQFMMNRIVRVVPLYWALTLGIFAVAVVAPGLVNATRADPVELVKSLLFVPFMKSNGLVQPVLFPGWTLNYEMFFYAVFAGALLIGSVRGRIMTVAAALAGLVAAGAIFPVRGTIPQFYTAPLLLEFAFGMLISWAAAQPHGRLPERRVSLCCIVAGFAAILLVPYAFDPVPVRLLTIGVPAAAIVYGMVALDAAGQSVRSPTAMLLGAASYAIYLVHPFVLGVLERVAHRTGLDHGPGLSVAMVVALTIALAVGVALHLLVERPLNDALRRIVQAGRGASRQPERFALWPWRR